MAILCYSTFLSVKYLMMVSSRCFNVIFYSWKAICWLILAAYRLVTSVGVGLGFVLCGRFK